MTPYRCKEVTAAEFTALLGFAARNNLTLVYGLNDMYGRPTKTKPEKALCTRPEAFNSTPMGVNSISSGSPHARPMWALSTCGEPDEIKKNTYPKHITAPFRNQAPTKAARRVTRRTWRRCCRGPSPPSLTGGLHKCLLLHPATPYQPSPRGKFHARGNMWSFAVG